MSDLNFSLCPITPPLCILMLLGLLLAFVSQIFCLWLIWRLDAEASLECSCALLGLGQAVGQGRACTWGSEGSWLV